MPLYRFLIPKRVILWLTPLAAMVVLVAGFAWTEGDRRLHRARELLVSGHSAAATEVLDGLENRLFVGPQVRAGLAIADAFEHEPRTGPEQAFHDYSAFDLPLIIRSAFERGEFGAVLRLTELAHAYGRPADSWVALAARIEQGLAPNEPAALAPPPVPSVLAERVVAHLASPPMGTVLRTRDGRALGYLVDGELKLAEGVDERWLPRRLGDLAAEEGGAGSIRTSLDLELSQAAAGAFGRFRGSIVLLDPFSGEILAAVSDRRTHAREAGTPAFEQYREPASISKLITTAAYLRAGRDPDARLARMECRGHESYSGERLYCPVIAGRLRGLDRAMAVSCNVAFAELATEIGRRSLVDELRRFGFDHRLGPFAGGRIVTPWGDDRQLADLAIGLDESELTPLHAAVLAATVATGGERPTPTLLRGIDGRLGLHPRPLQEEEATRVLRPEHAEVLHRSMVAVAERGTGQRMKTYGFPVAMKTGTASHPRHGFHVNYIGYGPLPQARLAFCVRITHQATSRRVRAAATEVTRRLLRRLRTVSRQRGWQHPVTSTPPQKLAERRERPEDRRTATAR